MYTKLAKIVEVTDDSVILSVNNAKLTWSKDDLPNSKVGDEVHIIAMTTNDVNKHKNDIAKSMLNNVLNPEK